MGGAVSRRYSRNESASVPIASSLHFLHDAFAESTRLSCEGVRAALLAHGLLDAQRHMTSGALLRPNDSGVGAPRAGAACGVSPGQLVAGKYRVQARLADGGIGVVDEWSQSTPAERATYQQAFGFETTARDYYALAGFTLDTSVVPNSGMFICSPASHRRFYTDLSRQWAASQFNHPRGFHYEQSVFGFALQQAGLQRLLPAAWNRIWPLYRSRETASPAARLRAFRRFTEVYADSFLLHLVSGQDHDFAYLLRDR